MSAGAAAVSRSPASNPARLRGLVLLLLVSFAYTGYMLRTSVAIAADRMMPELGLTQVEIGWLITAFLATYAFCQLPGALAGERFGARRVLAGIGLASVLASAATVGMPALFTGAVLLVSLVAARALLGIAQAALFPVAAGTIRIWFPFGRWAGSIGLLATGIWLGVASTPPLVAGLMEAYGWRVAILASSIPALVVSAIWWRVGRDRPEDHPRISAAELAELAGNPPTDDSRLTWRRVLGVLADRQVLLVTLSYLLMNYVFYLVTFWCFLYLRQERKFSVLESGWLAALPFLVAGAAGAIGGRISDRLCERLGERRGRRVVPLAALPCAAIFLYLTVTSVDPYGAVGMLCLAFACIELTEGSFWATTMRLVPRDAMAGTAVMNTGGNLGGVVATPIIAALSAGGGWREVFFTGAILALVAAGLWLAIDAGRELGDAPGVKS